ncbi:MAG: altronate dehydratase family protein [Bacteroidia bacterium]|nr:altronate dehydratase family protein [Bacteroidia bacterium]
MNNRVLKIHPSDNVIVALADLPEGEKVSYERDQFVIREKIQVKHKFAARDFAVGDPIYMYGVLVGKATEPIPTGGLLSTRNVKHSASEYALGQRRLEWNIPDVSRWKSATFMGYHRSDGKVGTANHWLVIPLVFCENRNVQVLKELLVDELGYGANKDYNLDIKTLKQMFHSGASSEEILSANIHLSPEQTRAKRFFPNVDGIKFLTHEGGCGGTRQDSQALCALLAGYITHPNVAGATVLSLGCQHAQVHDLEAAIAQISPNFDKPLYIYEQQKSRSEESLISQALKQTFVGLSLANELKRTPAPLSKLVVGLECGGSDGFSGISANPAIGHTADLVVALGGTAVLSEFPELCGVEQELSDRCVDEVTAEKFIRLMRTYDAAAVAVGSGFDMNPSPGNIRDGLITDAIKSAGAAKKGGTSPITDVLDYTEPITRPGLNLLCTPGNDVESTTALTGSGVTITLFTTGLGTPTGNPISPVIKVSSNTVLAERMPDIIDINAGTIISGEDTIETKGAEILDYIIKVASGEIIPHAVRLGQDDFIPWKRGISL